MELEMLQKIVSQVLNVDPREIKEDTTFIDDLGADSLDLLQIVMGVEEQFNIKVSEKDANNINTVGEALAVIRRLAQ